VGIFIIPDTVVPPYGAGGLNGLNGWAAGELVHPVRSYAHYGASKLQEGSRIYYCHELWPELRCRRTTYN